MPDKFKDVRIILLAKKDAICPPEQTRPISWIDSFLKIQERLYLNRLMAILEDKGLIPESQSGFLPERRLQTRVLLFLEQLMSYMSNSSPVATVFVDFKSAFDQLWFAGCLGKLLRMGISKADIKWIGVWLYNRRAVVEIAGKRSRWFPIKRGGPQGSCFTRILFITYRSDMENFLCMEMSFFFADDLAAAILSVQPINYIKTQAMFSARVVNYPNPMPRISCGGYAIEWVKTYKYLGYWVTTKI
ncbi:unnamed protein product, partial [Rotaria magnacalcarata]